jgi:hypothetical protein
MARGAVDGLTKVRHGPEVTVRSCNLVHEGEDVQSSHDEEEDFEPLLVQMRKKLGMR